MNLLEGLKVINVGLELFAESFHNQKVEVIHINWAPPAEGDDEILNILQKIDIGKKESK